MSHDEAVSTAVSQKSPAVGVVGEGRAVRFGAQIPMITELGEFPDDSIECFTICCRYMLIPGLPGMLLSFRCINRRVGKEP